MWNSEKILSKVVERTGMSVSEIQNCPWSELEKKMQITKHLNSDLINRRGHHHFGMRRVSRTMFDEDEKQIIATR